LTSTFFAKARELQKYQDAYGISSAQLQQLPEVVNTRHKHSLMVIPLAGGVGQGRNTYNIPCISMYIYMYLLYNYMIAH
jgi:hypothetical protein